MAKHTKGSFTLPGESGYEKLTLKMAEKWGADVIRDSDGTALSDEILNAGYEIYSTICIIRDHNEWATRHPQELQQTFLMSQPVTTTEEFLSIHLLDGYYAQQFEINGSRESVKFWQVFDRTSGKEVSPRFWNYEKESQNVVIETVIPFHEYTVNFLVYRIWEEISMYNHVTNNWNKEHLMPIDPRSQDAQNYLCKWLENWCIQHKATGVVRFTSLFYNFVWIWGSDERRRDIYTDWGSYDFTVSPAALEQFEKRYGYALKSEDFINQGKLHVTHMPPTSRQLDYMDFTNSFVVKFGKKLVDIVHDFGKKAYVFYDDSWIGIEPYGKRFTEFGFDGLIKCVFSGYEARLCAGAKAPIHELRLHPYLFPVGLGGAPTFAPGGDPAADAKVYWNRIRRALLRQPVDRIGLGGYLHLTEKYPDFNDYIEQIADEFRIIKGLHEDGKVYTFPCKVAVLHSWGALRSWTLSGHFHETYMHDLIHVNEALAGLPVDVAFISFEDVKTNGLQGYDVVINAGRAYSAWSGGDNWRDADMLTKIYKWVAEGGVFIGIGEPSAVTGYMNYFRMTPVLGMDEDTGSRVCHGKWQYQVSEIGGLIPEGIQIPAKENLFLTDAKTTVLAESNGQPLVTEHPYGKGKGIYLSGFRLSNASTRFLLNLLLYATGIGLNPEYLTDNPDTECAYYPKNGKLVVINNSEKAQKTRVRTEAGEVSFELEPYATCMREI